MKKVGKTIKVVDCGGLIVSKVKYKKKPFKKLKEDSKKAFSIGFSIKSN